MERNFFYARSLFTSCNAAFKPLSILPSPSSSSVAPPETKDLIKQLDAREDDTLDLDLSLSLKPPGTIIKKCYLCGTTKTPVWRNSCCGNKTLCNACGLEVRNKARKRSATMDEPAVPMKKKGKRGPSKFGERRTIEEINNL